MAYDEVLLGRLRDELADVLDVSEKRMFSGVSMLVAGRLAVAVTSQGLLVRVGPDGATEAYARGAEPFVMRGRPMTGWVLVTDEGLDDDALHAWVTQARAVVAELPPEPERRQRRAPASG
ncbi:TfoX/Sxy family protein [Cellulomonas alba]|uniref:TfoX/Sxy family protein n=1 Tax=Cellulomonas alba TaxID=3053467 RepID=A0ABT7SID3_9CELL|nr:TfoX/Sxy family protein [Cellulomonas alba]MDM7855942.1 TfoX/Sxy family protein [Cellulomonas alba]